MTIPTWANGPDGSGNGGWSAGLLAQRLGPAALADGAGVDLRMPPPVGRPLRVHREGVAVEAWDDDGEAPALVARAAPTVVPLEVPAAADGIDVAAATRATEGFPFRARHPFPRCVSCGTERAAGEPALHLWAGPVAGRSATDDSGASVPLFATPWTPDARVSDQDEPTRASFPACWSALDCPSATPVADPDAAHPAVLARMEAHLVRPPRIGDEHVVVAWRRSVDGRKRWTGSALLDGTGELLGVARALWIEVRPR